MSLMPLNYYNMMAFHNRGHNCQGHNKHLPEARNSTLFLCIRTKYCILVILLKDLGHQQNEKQLAKNVVF